MDNETKLMKATLVLTCLLALSVFMNFALGFVLDKTLKSWREGDDKIFHAWDSCQTASLKEIDSIYRH